MMLVAILFFAAQIVVGPPPVITTGTTVISPQPITGALSFSPQPIAKDPTGKLNSFMFTTLVDRSNLDPTKQMFVLIEQSPDGLSWSFLCSAVVSEQSVKPASFSCPINAKISQQVRGTITAKANTGQKTEGIPDPTKEADATVSTTASIAVQ